MAFTFVQAKSTGTADVGATSIVVTPDSACTADNLVAGVVTWSGTPGQLTNVSDGTITATITRTIEDATNGQCAASFRFDDITGGATTITANFGASVQYRGISVTEYGTGGDTASLDGTNEQGQLQTAPGTGTDGAKSGAGTMTPSQNDCLVWGGGVKTGITGGGGSEFAAGTSFTEPAGAEHSVLSAISLSSEYWIQTTSTAANASFTVTVDDDHITLMQIFKLSAGGPPPPPPRITHPTTAVLMR